MDLKLKVGLYNLIDKLPTNIASILQYSLQKHLGQLRNYNPIGDLKTGISVVADAIEQRQQIESCSVIEIGTGRRINVPISLYLLGIYSVFSIDLNSYLKWELIEQDIDFIKANVEQIKNTFPPEIRSKNFESRF